MQVLILRLLIPCTVTHASEPPDTAALLGILKIPAAELSVLANGDTIPYAVAEKTENEIALGMAMMVSHPVAETVEVVSQGKLFLLDPAMQRSGGIPAGPGSATLGDLPVFADETGYALSFLEAEPGDQFNLSLSEFRGLHPLQIRLNGAESRVLRDEASRYYRELLSRRWQSYRNWGLSGIPSYARVDGTADPASELRSAAESNGLLARFFPDLHRAWLKYPTPLPTGIEEEFRWLNRLVEDRPTPILLHWMAQAHSWGAVIVEREYYVGHSYNSSETLAGCMAYRGGSLVFYQVRSYTDQVAGMGSELKRAIGRQVLKEEMTQRLERLRDLMRRR